MDAREQKKVGTIPGERARVDAGTPRVAWTPTLPRGGYTVRVLAGNHGGVWNQKGASFSFRRPPRFRETTTFWVVVAAGVSEFLLVVAHAKLRGATGAWVAPLAVV